MKPNIKKPLTLKNRTKFFDPSKDKAYVTFASTESYTSKKMKIEGYETRLYWQYKYCESIGGQTFFYTLTYADKNLPQKYGTNCFDYEDLRDLFTGGFRKMLLRKYGTSFKYFVGAELGDGKGQRGFQNNPHYHVLFFLEPSPFTYTKTKWVEKEIGTYKRNTKFHRKGETKYKKVKEEETIYVPYTPIEPKQFRHLIRKYWQGFDQDTDGRKDFDKYTKYGIAKEGEPKGCKTATYGKVIDFNACIYCAKYVCKDIRLKAKEVNIKALLNLRLRNELQTSIEFYKDFMHEVIYPLYNIPENAKGEWRYNEKDIMYELQPKVLKKYLNKEDITTEETFISDIKRLCYKEKLWPKFNNFLYERIEQLIQTAITEWRNRYCNKCRISQGVGDYALDFITDKSNPKFHIDTKQGPKERPMTLYYYRKLFTTVIYPTFQDFKGNYHLCNPTRVLNEDGICYKVEKLKEKINKKAEEAKNSIEIILNRPDLFEMMKNSDVNTEVWCNHNYFREKYYDSIKDNINIYERYGEYKLVYEGRYFKIQNERHTDIGNFPIISPYDDYARFLIPSAYSVDRSDLYLDCFLDSNNEGYLLYREHPYFLRYTCIFDVLDLLADYFFIQMDDKKEEEARKTAEIRRFHKGKELREYYNTLTN